MQLKWLAVAVITCPVFAQTVELGTPPVPTWHITGGSRSVARQPQADRQWIDTQSRSAVRNAYLNEFMPTTDVPIGWTGNHEGGDPGDTSMAYKQAAIDRVNFIRGLAGVPAWVRLNLEFSRKSQQAAFMMSTNKALSHFPPDTWMNFTADGAEAAQKSNLCLSFNRPPDPGCVVQYIQDSGQGNEFVGHRRWINNPATQEMGTGDVPQSGEFPTANSLWVFDDHIFDPRPPTRDEFVAWPPPGFIPQDLIFDRWSFSFPDADFLAANVAVQRDGQPVAVQILPQQQGFGENTIVWEEQATGGITANHEGDVVTNVTVSNVMVDGQARQFGYQVTAFDPLAEVGPEFTAAGLVNAASFVAGPLTSEAWTDLFGTNLASQFVLDGSFPTVLDNARIDVTDGAGTQRPARLHFVSPDRIQFLTPLGMAEGNGSLRVTNSDGVGASIPVQIARTRPGFFTANASGQGPAAATWLREDAQGNRTGDFTFTLDPPPNRQNVPIDLGGPEDQVFLNLFGTSFRSQSSANCTVGGIQTGVLGAVAQGVFDGLDQANIGPLSRQLAGRGIVDVNCIFDGVPANTVTVAVQ